MAVLSDEVETHILDDNVSPRIKNRTKGQRSVFRPGVSVWKMTTTSNGTELTKITSQNKINSLTTDEQEIIEDELPDINVNISQGESWFHYTLQGGQDATRCHGRQWCVRTLLLQRCFSAQV